MPGVAIVLAVFSLIGMMLASSRWLAGRRLATAGHLLLAAASAAAAIVLWPIAANLEAYDRLAPDQPAAELYFEQTGSRHFRATLTRLPRGHIQVFEMSGDQWRIDARTLTWKDRAARLGLQPRFRLERLSARHTSRDVDPGRAVAGYPLGRDAGTDIWTCARNGSRWDRHVEARHAYGPWRPMANGARFEVRLRGSALEADPVNEAAAASLQPRG